MKMLAGFFFFQAEDGIRDVAVTGVQTCALPISRHRSLHAARGVAAGADAGVSEEPVVRRPYPAASLSTLGVGAQHAAPLRSEERRVGKECRSRWSPYH